MDASSKVTNQVYYGMDAATSGSVYAQYNESANASVVRSSYSAATNTFYSTTFIDDALWLGGGSSSIILSGTVHAEYTGTATFSAGSPTVTAISSTLTAAQQKQMVGSWVINTGDSSSTLAVYRVQSVDSSSQITLDRNFDGSNTGSGKAIQIAAAVTPRCSTNAFFTTSSSYAAFYTASAWGRLVVGGPVTNLPTFAFTDTYRLRWSGIVGSDEGTSPFTGIYAYHDDGYRDFKNDGGPIIDIKQTGDAVVVFQRRQINVIYGSPVFDGAGSLDFSTIYPFRQAGSIGVSVDTPYGLYYLDKIRGLCLFDGSGAPRDISKYRANKFIQENGLTRIAYFGDNIFMYSTSDIDVLVYNVPSDSFSSMKTTGKTFTRPQTGRGSIDNVGTGEELFVELDTDSGKITDIGYAFSYPYVTNLEEDYETSAVSFVIETPPLGDPTVLLRPERITLTYRTLENTDTDPWVKVTVQTGLDASPSSDHVYATTSADFTDTAGAYVTKVLEIPDVPARDTMLAIKIESQNKAVDFEIVRCVVEGTAEGRGSTGD